MVGLDYKIYLRNIRIAFLNTDMGEGNGTLVINLRDNTEDAIERFDIKSCNFVNITGIGPELSLNQAG